MSSEQVHFSEGMFIMEKYEFFLFLTLCSLFSKVSFFLIFSWKTCPALCSLLILPCHLGKEIKLLSLYEFFFLILVCSSPISPYTVYDFPNIIFSTSFIIICIEALYGSYIV
jgi:hypothetical protein